MAVERSELDALLSIENMDPYLAWTWLLGREGRPDG